MNDPALNEKNAYLTEFLDPEECDDPLADKILAFVCEAGDQCTLGDPKDRTPGCHSFSRILQFREGLAIVKKQVEAQEEISVFWAHDLQKVFLTKCMFVCRPNF